MEAITEVQDNREEDVDTESSDPGRSYQINAITEVQDNREEDVDTESSDPGRSYQINDMTDNKDNTITDESSAGSALSAFSIAHPEEPDEEFALGLQEPKFGINRRDMTDNKDNTITDESSAGSALGAFSIAHPEEPVQENRKSGNKDALVQEGDKTSSHSLQRHLKYLHKYNASHSDITPNKLDFCYYRQILDCFQGTCKVIDSETDLCYEVLKDWFRTNNDITYVKINECIKNNVCINNNTEYICFKPANKETEIENYQKLAETKLDGRPPESILFTEVDDIEVTLKRGQKMLTCLSLKMYPINDYLVKTVMFKLYFIDPLELCLAYMLQTKQKHSVESLHSPHCKNCPFQEILKLCTVESIKFELIQLNINGNLEMAKKHFIHISNVILEMSASVTKFAYSTAFFTFTLRNKSTHKVNNFISPTIEIKFEREGYFRYNTIKIRYCNSSTPSPNGQSTTSVVDQSE